MILNDWDIFVVDDNLLTISISENVDIEGLEVVLIDEFRIPIVKFLIESRSFDIQLPTDKPMFAKIGESVRYVTGSGGSSYK